MTNAFNHSVPRVAQTSLAIIRTRSFGNNPNGTIHLLPAMPEFSLFRSACEFDSVAAGKDLPDTRAEEEDDSFRWDSTALNV
jgi:hypothetical protein